MQWLNESRLFELARMGKRLPHWLVVLIMTPVFLIGSQLGAIPVVLGLAVMQGGSLDASQLPALPSALWFAAILVSAFGPMFLLIWLWVWLFEKRKFVTVGYELAGAVWKYGRGFMAGAGMFVGAVAVMAALGMVTFEAGPADRQGVAALAGVLIVLVGWLVQGASEELLTRGWILPVVGARYKPWMGVLVSAGVFAGLHGLNSNIGVLPLVNLALFGLFAAVYALREGGLWGVSALHSAWNWVQGNVVGLAVSGGDAGGGTLVNLAEAGPDWLTGGAFGPEGGVLVTVVLVIGIAVVVAWPRGAVARAKDVPVAAD